MSPQLPNASKMQDEFLKTFAESAVRVAEAWSEALKGAGLRPQRDHKTQSTSAGSDPADRLKTLLPGVSPARFQEMVEKAARDLPDLVMAGRDDKTVRRIKNKWLEEYEDFSREFFGIPAPSETRNALSEWKTLLERGLGWGYPPGLMPGFPPSPLTLGWFPAGRFGVGSDLFQAWEKAYEKTFGKMFPFPSKPDSMEHLDKSFKQAVDAQISFLNSLTRFHEQVVKTASAAVDVIVDEVARLNVKEVSEDTYRIFYRTWLAQNEKAFHDLAESGAVSKSLAETAEWGTEAKKKMADFLADGFSVFEASNRGELEKLSRSVEVMAAQIDRLEEDVRRLRRQVAALSAGEGNEEK